MSAHPSILLSYGTTRRKVSFGFCSEICPLFPVLVKVWHKQQTLCVITYLNVLLLLLHCRYVYGYQCYRGHLGYRDHHFLWLLWLREFVESLSLCRHIVICNVIFRWSRWPHGLRDGSMATRLLGLRVRIQPAAWIYAACECCVLSERGFYVGLIIHPEVSYRMWCAWV